MAFFPIQVETCCFYRYNDYMNYEYLIYDDIKTACESLNIDLSELANRAGLSVKLLTNISKEEASQNSLERFYSFCYKSGIRFSQAKTEIYQENLKGDETLLFHGSKFGIDEIKCDGSRETSDFSNGFYCSDNISSAISFVEDSKDGSIYVFSLKNEDKLRIKTFDCSMEWMLIICYYRKMIKDYQNSEMIKKLIDDVSSYDLIIAPIANNKMFQVMQQFGRGEITTVQAMHALSASRLGKQYIFKTKKAISSLNFLERLYLCQEEKDKSIQSSLDRAEMIQTKLDLARRQYRTEGKYIDELLI